MNIKNSLESFKLNEIVTPLCEWYNVNKRTLPWRQDTDPYRIWISEIMLQQTRVEAVKPYFERFLQRLPDIEALANVEEEELLKLWEGLGYYSRARNLKEAAILLVTEYGGKMPNDYEKLLSLKGIGSYTAGAISSIAFGLPYPAVDGNVLRVLARLRMDERKINDPNVKKQVERELLPIMPLDSPGDLNQALMELGACVCIPNGKPFCDACPVQTLCLAYREGVTEFFPKKDQKQTRRIEKKTVLIIRTGDAVILHKRPKQGLLAGMYELPSLEGHQTSVEVYKYLSDKGLSSIQITPAESTKHIFTHKEWHMIGYVVRTDEFQPLDRGNSEGWIYADIGEIEVKYPIPSAFAAYVKYLQAILRE